MQRCSRCCTRQFGSEEAARPSLSLTVTASLRHCVTASSSLCPVAATSRHKLAGVRFNRPGVCTHLLPPRPTSCPSYCPSHPRRTRVLHLMVPVSRLLTPPPHSAVLTRHKNQIHSHVRYKNPSLFLFLRLFVCCFALLQDSFSAFFFTLFSL